jgi:hypothetical protein
MVNLWSLSLLACLMIGQDPAQPSPTSADEESSKVVRSALGKRNFPWYDSKTDSAKPINLRPEPTPTPNLPSFSFLRFLGQFITLIGFGIALAILIGLLVWFWRIYEPNDLEKVAEPRKQGVPSRVEALPEGMEGEFQTSDPWQEAIRRRNRGDLAGAIICLFAHQLLTLSKLGLVRLAPGRTGRQILKAVTDSEFRGLVHPTLRLFEVVYYGHRNPTEGEFAVVWTQAEAFERRVASGVIQ